MAYGAYTKRYSKKYMAKGKKYKKRVYRKKRGGKNYGTSFFPNVNGPQHSTAVIRGKDYMPETLYTNMEYREQVGFSGSSTGSTYVYRGNSLYDPNQTGTGSQPIGYSIVSQIYSYYECPSSTIRVEWVNAASTPIWITIAPIAASSDAVTYSNSIGIPGAKNAYAESTNGNQHGILTNGANTKSMLGLQFGDVDTRALMTANPGQQWYWKISLDSFDNVSTLSGILNVTVRYKAKFTNRKITG